MNRTMKIIREVKIRRKTSTGMLSGWEITRRTRWEKRAAPR